MIKHRFLVFALLLGALILNSCTKSSDQTLSTPLIIENLWARPGAAGDNSAVYFDVTSNSGDRLLNASSEIAGSVEIHLSKMEDGVMKMEHQSDGIIIPLGETIHLEPGGYHIMLIELNRELLPEDTFQLKLEFDHSTPVVLDVIVKQP